MSESTVVMNEDDTRLELVRPYRLLRTTFGSTSRKKPAAIRAALICSLPALLVLIGCAIDGTLIMKDGVGALEHPGFITFVLTSPLIAYLTWQLLGSTAELLRNLPQYTLNGQIPAELQQIISRNLEMLKLRTPEYYALAFFSMVGMTYTLLNLWWMRDSQSFYGIVAFDSIEHPFGFALTRLYIGITLIYIYPTAIFVCMAVTVLLHQVLGSMSRSGILKIELFHPDNCGGFSAFGRLNLIIMVIYFCLLCELIALVLTHRDQINVQILPAGIVFALIITQSFAAVYYIHRCVQAKRKDALDAISKELDQTFHQFPKTSSAYGDLLSVRTHLLGLKTFPYARHALGVVNFLRFAPPLAALLQLLARR